MATVYVDPVCVKDSIDFFISQEYTSPDSFSCSRQTSSTVVSIKLMMLQERKRDD